MKTIASTKTLGLALLGLVAGGCSFSISTNGGGRDPGYYGSAYSYAKPLPSRYHDDRSASKTKPIRKAGASSDAPKRTDAAEPPRRTKPTPPPPRRTRADAPTRDPKPTREPQAKPTRSPDPKPMRVGDDGPRPTRADDDRTKPTRKPAPTRSGLRRGGDEPATRTKDGGLRAKRRAIRTRG